MGEADHLKRGNLLWESSRMFLPEHREQLLEQRRRKRDYIVPALEEDRLSELNDALSEALQTGRTAAVTYADPSGPLQLIGRITRVDPLNATLRIENAEYTVTVHFDQLLDLH